ncbi:MAG: hypothetical protein ACK5NG_09140 [Chthoniobacterales bacterium]
MSFWEKFHQYFRSHEIPFAYWEMLFIRFVFAWLIYASLPGWVSFTSQPKPDALANWIDFTFLSHTPIYNALWWLAVASLIFYVLGLFQVIGLSYLAALFISIGTLENSQGAAEHYRQLLTLAILAQALVAWWQILWTADDSSEKVRRWWLLDIKKERQLIHWTRIMIAGVYLTMAITKIDRSDGRWLWDTPNLSVQIIKTHANDFANTGVATDPFYLETLPKMIADNPNLSRIFFAPGLLLELFLFLGLISRSWSLFTGISAILLHRGIEILMGLNFVTHEWMLWIFFVNPPYWIYRLFFRYHLNRP